jgi:phage baseplate assembly protein V
VTVQPRARTTDRRYYGVVEGLVVEAVSDPANEGRVKVKFPWFDDGTVSEWCRVAQPYAGNGYGMVLTPEVGDEVVVGFSHGDMRLPIVLGGLYNGKDKPPASRTDTDDKKLVRTKGGHELLFDDSSAGPKIVVTSAAGHKVTLDDDPGTVTVETSGGQSLVLDAAGKATLKADSITLQGSSITLDGAVSLGGSGASHPLVFGDDLLQVFSTHVHNATAIGSPTSPPMPPAVVQLQQALSTKTKTA